VPKNISFALTTDQIRNRTKTVTRRLGWKSLKPGQILNACVKCMGLKPGEQIQRLGQIRVVDVTFEPLDTMLQSSGYGRGECEMEGFPAMTGKEFVEMFKRHMKCDDETEVTRIEFEYVDAEPDGPKFKFIEFNPRRKARGAEAARVACDGSWLWMSKRDVELNIRDFGPHPELLKALESYK